MQYSLKELAGQARNFGTKLVDEAIGISGAQAALCARYGYGLTVKSEGETFFFHLPDIATDVWQARMLQETVLPDEEVLLRLRRRGRVGLTILENCAGCGVRTVFYAKSMQAARVYALGGSVHGVSLIRKNVLLNDMESIVHAYWLDVSGEAAEGTPAGAAGTIDGFCGEQQIGQVDLLSLNAQGLGAGGLTGVTGTLRSYGPAVIVWGQDLRAGEASKITEDMRALGYGDPEMWTADVMYWTSRV